MVGVGLGMEVLGMSDGDCCVMVGTVVVVGAVVAMVGARDGSDPTASCGDGGGDLHSSGIKRHNFGLFCSA